MTIRRFYTSLVHLDGVAVGIFEVEDDPSRHVVIFAVEYHSRCVECSPRLLDILGFEAQEPSFAVDSKGRSLIGKLGMKTEVSVTKIELTPKGAGKSESKPKNVTIKGDTPIHI